MTRYDCSRCGGTLNREGEPVEENAKYVKGRDFFEKQEKEVLYAVMHTEESRELCEELADKVGMSDQEVSFSMAREEMGKLEVEFDRGEMLEEVRVKSPNELRDHEYFIRCESRTEEVEVEKTALVCPGCVEETDEIIW